MHADHFEPGHRVRRALRAGLRSPVFIGAALLTLLAAGLRAPALSTDFWEDEIRSYEQFALHARSVLDIFLNPAFKHDNNHYLNTVFLYVFRDHPGWIIYRWPAFLAGLATVAVVVVAGSRRSRAEGVFSGLLVAISFLMVVYSTEARGYALVLLFALLGLVTLGRYLDSPSRPLAAVFWLWIALGLAAQSCVAHFYVGALFWSGYRLRRRLKDLAWLHVVPLVWAALWAGVVLWGSRIGGGDPWTWQQITDEGLAWTIGYPLGTVPAFVALAGAIALVVWDARRLWVEGSDEGLFYVAVIFGPAVFVAGLNPPWLFPRYFLVSLFFLLLVAGRQLARLWRRPAWGKPLVGLLVGALILGNLHHAALLWRYGRGGSAQAIAYIVSHSTEPEIVVTSPSVGLWSTLPINFYERKLNLGNRIRFISREQLSAGAATGVIDWVLVPSDDQASTPARRLDLTHHGVYTLRESYPVYGPSGLRWSVYQRAEQPPATTSR